MLEQGGVGAVAHEGVHTCLRGQWTQQQLIFAIWKYGP